MMDESQMRKALNILKPDGTLFEVRMLQSQPKRTMSGYFKDADTAIEELKKVNLRNWNVFFTLNSVQESCYDRIQHNELKTPQNTTSDQEIEVYTWLLVDLDPERLTGISSSNEELEKAKALGRRIYTYLKQEGFEEPVIAMSGNGIHLLYRIWMNNTETNVELIKRFLQALDLMFSDDEIHVDTANFNPSRICKLYGTVAQKGAGTEDRPHRMSYIISAPDKPKVTLKAYIEKIANMLPKQEKPQPYNNYMPKQFDIVEWMDKHGLRYEQKSASDYTKYVLDECPFDRNHKAPDSMITVGRSGAIGFKCLHNSCSHRTWKDVRLLFEPDAYDREDNNARIQAGWNKHKQYNRDKIILYDKPKEEDGVPVFMTAKQILDEPTETEDYILTGIDGIDNRMMGLKKGAVSVLSGLRGGSKSTWLTEIALNAVNQGHNVICYSGELTRKNFMKWMFLQAAGKDHVKKMNKGAFYYVTDDDKEKIADWLGDRFLLYRNDYGNNFQELYARLETQIKEQKTDLVILDNLMALDIRDLDPGDKYSAQKIFLNYLISLAKRTLVHVLFVAHPRKANGFLRLEDISGTNDIVQLVDNGFIIHRNNMDFRRLSKEMFKWPEDYPAYKGTNVLEIAKERDFGTQDVFIPLWYEPETKRLKNSEAEKVIYGWANDGFSAIDDNDEIPF